MIGHTVVITEQRGVYYAEVLTLNGTNIVPGESPYNAFIKWRNINKGFGFNPTKVHLKIDGKNDIISLPEFIEQYQ